MEQNYSRQELAQAGLDLTKVLMDMATKENDGNTFLKSYLNSLTSEDGLYKRQSDAIQNFSDSSEKLEETTHSILNSIQDNSQKIDNISTQFAELNKKMEEIQQKRREMDRKMKELEAFIKKIRGFVQDIQDISDHTNLLSFNASIEAAHAGSAGAGFRIIANEVKKLSEQTRSTSNSITSQIEDLNSRVETVVKGNAEYDDFLNQIRDITTRSGANLEEIKNGSLDNARSTEEMYQNMKANQENIIQSTREVKQANISQIKEIADHATKTSIITNDRLSFLLQMNNLFKYIQTHSMDA